MSGGIAFGFSVAIDRPSRPSAAFPQGACCVVMQRAERLAAFHGVSNAFVNSSPTAGSIVSSFFRGRRPAPACHANCSHCVAAMNPSVGLVTSSVCRACGSRRDHRSPYVSPLQPHDFPEFFRAVADAIKSRRVSSLLPRFSRAHQEEHHARVPGHNSRRSAGPVPLTLRSTRQPPWRCRLSTEGWFISVSSATTFFPCACRFREQLARFAASSIFFMKAPDRSSHRAPARQFLG